MHKTCFIQVLWDMNLKLNAKITEKLKDLTSRHDFYYSLAVNIEKNQTEKQVSLKKSSIKKVRQKKVRQKKESQAEKKKK
jgi:hypothetical protein